MKKIVLNEEASITIPWEDAANRENYIAYYTKNDDSLHCIFDNRWIVLRPTDTFTSGQNLNWPINDKENLFYFEDRDEFLNWCLKVTKNKENKK